MKQNNTLILRQEHPFSLAFATWFIWCIYISIFFFLLWLVAGGINELHRSKSWWEPIGAIAALVLAVWTIKYFLLWIYNYFTNKTIYFELNDLGITAKQNFDTKYTKKILYKDIKEASLTQPGLWKLWGLSYIEITTHATSANPGLSLNCIKDANNIYQHIQNQITKVRA